jgi:sterol 3beta-glucosyltransferase
MNISILTLGTRGDVQPYVALGLGLQRAGHYVKLITDSGFAALVRDHGLSFTPLETGIIQLAQSAQGKAAMAGKGRLRLMKEVMPMLRRMMDDTWVAAQDSDAVIYHAKILSGIHIAEKLNVPGYLAMAMPAYSPTTQFANPVMGGGNYGAWLNKLSYTILNKASTLPFRKLVNTFRREQLAMPPFKDDVTLSGKPVPKLYAYSQYVVPRPTDWTSDTHVTGYWFLPATSAWKPAPELLSYLSAGPPPVYIGFGSMSSEDTATKTAIVLDAMQQTGQRAVLATGWGGLAAMNAHANAPANVFVLDNAPHDWLFPQCAAVVHHGGAGTTAAGLRAGKPTVVVPFFGDQPFWGRRVHALGVGPQPIPQKNLTAAALADAIRQATTDVTMQAKARRLGEFISAEDGVANAVSIITRQTDTPH